MEEPVVVEQQEPVAGRPVDPEPAGPAPPDRPGLGAWRERSAQLATWTFGAYVLLGAVLLLFVIGDFYWFFRDDWFFLTDRELSDPEDLFRDHNGHWSTVPVVVFRVLYGLFGITTYLPYQAVVVALHLAVVVLIRMVMRRAGVGPWLATVVAAAAVLLGSGREDILWAFQIGFTGSIAFGLLQLVLADHDGPVGRRDLLAVGAGALALMSSSPGLIVVAATTGTILVKRGWRPAALQAAPLAAAYLVWTALVDPRTTSPYSDPEAGDMAGWVRAGTEGNFLGMVDHGILATLLAAVVVAGIVLAVVAPGGHDRRRPVPSVAWERFRLLVAPVALFGATFVFMLLSVQSRFLGSADAAAASRYTYFYVVLTLPVVAVAGQALAHRWRPAVAVVPVLLLLGVPGNVDQFDDPPFGEAYHAHEKAVFTNVPRVPYIGQVPRDLRPLPNPYNSEFLDVGFLVAAEAAGKLDPPDGPMPPALADELYVRLGIRQGPAPGFPAECRPVASPQVLRPAEGDVYVLLGKVRVRAVEDGRPVRRGSIMDPAGGSWLTVVRSGLRVHVSGPLGGPPELCQVPG